VVGVVRCPITKNLDSGESVMMRTLRRWLAAVVLAVLAHPARTVAQEPAIPEPLGPNWALAAPPAPAPREEAKPKKADSKDKAEEKSTSQTVLERPPAYVLPSPDLPPPQFPHPDILLDRPCLPLPGCYANVGANLLFSVHLRNQLSIPVVNTVTGNTDTVQFKGNPLSPTVSPRFEVGYRFEDGCGALQLSYRFLATRGSIGS
jgi:hypothetical protein